MTVCLNKVSGNYKQFRKQLFDVLYVLAYLFVLSVWVLGIQKTKYFFMHLWFLTDDSNVIMFNKYASIYSSAAVMVYFILFVTYLYSQLQSQQMEWDVFK